MALQHVLREPSRSRQPCVVGRVMSHEVSGYGGMDPVGRPYAETPRTPINPEEGFRAG